jgi:hypothetical protein
LKLFRSNPRIRAVILYRADGEVFARYPLDGPSPPLPETGQTWQHAFDGWQLVLWYPVRAHDRQLGTLLVQRDLADVRPESFVHLDPVGGRVDIGPLPALEADRTQVRQWLRQRIDNGLKG